MNNKCRYCGRPLNESQFIEDENGNTFKSCPKCSTIDGGEHIYYQYPFYFGTTEKRISEQHPDGPQSYCQKCRGDILGPHDGAIKCSDLKKII